MSTIKVPEKSAKKLKLTATNIKSVLIKGNKDIAKIRADQRKLADERAQLEATQGREGGLEKKSPLKNIGKKVGKKIGSASKGIFDKVMQVAMPLALAVIVNNFEKITEALQKFYDNNKWIFDIVKTVFTTIGKGFMMLVNLIDGIQQNSEKKKLNEVKKDADALKESKAEVDELESTLKEIQKEVGIDPETGESTESVNEDKGDDQVLSAEDESYLDDMEKRMNQPDSNVTTTKSSGLLRGGEVVEGDMSTERALEIQKSLDNRKLQSQGIDTSTSNNIKNEIKSDSGLKGVDVKPGNMKKIEKQDPGKSLIKMEGLNNTGIENLASVKKRKPRTIVVHTKIIEKAVPVEV